MRLFKCGIGHILYAAYYDNTLMADYFLILLKAQRSLDFKNLKENLDIQNQRCIQIRHHISKVV